MALGECRVSAVSLVACLLFVYAAEVCAFRELAASNPIRICCIVFGCGWTLCFCFMPTHSLTLALLPPCPLHSFLSPPPSFSPTTHTHTNLSTHPTHHNTAVPEAVRLLTDAFTGISIQGQRVPTSSDINAMPPFALRRNAGGGGKAGKPSGNYRDGWRNESGVRCIVVLHMCGMH